MSDQITKSRGRKQEFDGDSWETPQWLFDWLDSEFHFTLDAAANHENAKCKHYFTKEDDALSRSWYGYTVFCNPPYSRGMKKKFFDHADEQCRNAKVTSVFVVPALPSEGWFPHDTASVVIWISGGRVGFVNPVTKEENPNPPSGTCVIVFTPHALSATTYKNIDRDAIRAIFEVQT